MMPRYITSPLEEEGATITSTAVQTGCCGSSGFKELLIGFVSCMCRLPLPNLVAEYIIPNQWKQTFSEFYKRKGNSG